MELLEHLSDGKPFHKATRKERLTELIRSNFGEITQAKERGYSWSQIRSSMREIWPDICFGACPAERIYNEIRKEKTMLNNNSNIAITTFNYGDNPVRTIEIDNEIQFVGKDVAEILGYSNTRDALMKHVDDEDKNTVAIHDGIQGNPNQTVINESGLYSLILSSKLPTAKKFKRWVTSEVLPSIRKTGTYATGSHRMSDEEIQFRTKELEARNRELDMRGAEIIQRMLDKPPFPITPETQTIFANEVFRLSSGHDCLAMLPECTDKWYTATDIGKLLGITPNKVGRIATANKLKAPEGESNEYGRWIFSKSKYSNREVPSFIYNDNGLDWFKSHQER